MVLSRRQRRDSVLPIYNIYLFVAPWLVLTFSAAHDMTTFWCLYALCPFLSLRRRSCNRWNAFFRLQIHVAVILNKKFSWKKKIQRFWEGCSWGTLGSSAVRLVFVSSSALFPKLKCFAKTSPVKKRSVASILSWSCNCHLSYDLFVLWFS